MAEEGTRPICPLVECCPLYSNYFAYSSGEEGSGIDLYRIYRSPEIDAEDGGGEAGLVGQRERYPYGAFALNQASTAPVGKAVCFYREPILDICSFG